MDDKNIADAFSAWFSSPVPIREHHADAMEYLIILGEESSDYDDVVDAICFRAGYKAALSTIDPETTRAEARAEALKEAAEKAARFVERFNENADEGAGDFWTTADLRAAILADEPKKREEEAGWMIEKHNPMPMWWNGCPKREGNGAWSSEPNDGIRFCRKLDAELCAIAQGFSLSKVLITEHRWG